ncbi:MAG: phasin family protein [Acidobacteriota bacterium]|jgi:poly(hydroxyalkanoate) granule-associated protein
MTEKTSGEKDVRKELKESAQRIWLAGLGALAVAEEEGTKAFNSLVDRGREWEAHGKERVRERVEEVRSKARSRFEGRFEEVEEMIDERITDAMHRFGVPSREEIHDLSSKVEELTKKIEALHKEPKPGSSR